MDNVVSKKEKKVSMNGKKYKINIKRLLISSTLIVLVIFIFFLLIFGNKKINSNTDITKINASKYYKQILSEYEKDGMKQNFLDYYDKLQTAIGMYIFNNSTLDSNSFSDISNTLNNELKSGKLEKIGIEKSTIWNGNFYIDSSGILKFKFENKNIEPSWSRDSDLQSKLEFN